MNFYSFLADIVSMPNMYTSLLCDFWFKTENDLFAFYPSQEMILSSEHRSWLSCWCHVIKSNLEMVIITLTTTSSINWMKQTVYWFNMFAMPLCKFQILDLFSLMQMVPCPIYNLENISVDERVTNNFCGKIILMNNNFNFRVYFIYLSVHIKITGLNVI